MKPKVLYLTKRWQHHTASGGYDRLATTYGGDVVSRSVWSFGKHLLHKTIDRSWSPPDLLDYTYLDLCAERKAVAKACISKPHILHALYGDDQLDLILRRKKQYGAKLVASFHLPWFRSRERFERQKELIDMNLDAAVCVSSDLARDINAFFGREIAFYVPHGIDTAVFRPCAKNHNSNDRLKLLTVGFHMRDMPLIHRTIDWAAAHSLPVDFEYIGPEWTWNNFTGCDNITVRSNVSEDELIKAYSMADALLMPVTAATANNSLLEAIACGLPVISTRIGGIPDYLDEASGWLLPPGGEAELRELVQRLTLERNEAVSKRMDAAHRGLSFDWKNTNTTLETVYEIMLFR